VLVCAAVPAVAVWRKPRLVAEAVGLAMAAFLLLSPAFGVQYLVWPLVFCYLVTFWSATAYNLLAGAWLVNVYSTHWSGGFLWYAAHAPAGGFTFLERVSVAVVWGALLVVVCQGVWRMASTIRRCSSSGAMGSLSWRMLLRPSRGLPTP
jgi:hypothetical protein